MNNIELDKLIEETNWDVQHYPTPLGLKQLKQLLLCAQELKTWRTNGVTEELLRRHDGCLKVGNGCVVTLESALPTA